MSVSGFQGFGSCWVGKVDHRLQTIASWRHLRCLRVCHQTLIRILRHCLRCFRRRRRSEARFRAVES
jgi:hypothetical protein